MAKKPLPCPHTLRLVMRYEQDTGKLFHATRPAHLFPDTPRRANAASIWNSRFAGKEAFTCTDAYGYKIGNMFGTGLKAHRVAWAIHYGEWPRGDIDHINGDRSDNRLVNLREATRAQNLANTQDTLRPHKWRGIRPVGNRWTAVISVDNRPQYLGTFPCPTVAAIAWDAAAKDIRGDYAATNFP